MVQITVITICLQAQNFIEKTIRSVMEQKNCHFEFLIEDGLSKDGTMNQIKKVIAQNNNPNIILNIYSEQDQGIYDAMNKAVKRAHGNWIFFLNAGDMLFDDNVLEKVQKILEQSDADIVYGDTVMRDISGDAIFKADMSLITKRMPFAHQSAFTRKILLLDMPFSLSYKIASDYDFYTKVYVAGKRFQKIEKIISVFMMDGVSSTKFIEKLYENEEILYQRGFIRQKYGFHFKLRYIVALLKTFVIKNLPLKFQYGIRRLYMKKIKGYL